MKTSQAPRRSIWLNPRDEGAVEAIDQRRLPHALEIMKLCSADDAAEAIRGMAVRGAGLIGVTAGFGMHLAARRAPDAGFDRRMEEAAALLRATRPTAVNLSHAVERQLAAMKRRRTPAEKRAAALETAKALLEEDVQICRRIGEHGLRLLEDIARRKAGGTVNVLTHCNAGWLAFVDRGTATAPVYEAHERGLPVHVWVEETRPRNQGAALTAWELAQRGVPHSVIVDNAGGHVMQRGMVDIVLTGTDRTTRLGDVCNKIGTYKTALAARDNHIPFYVALPSSSLDWSMRDGLKEIPIEERGEDEVTHAEGLLDGSLVKVRMAPPGSPARNYAFDVTPARLVTGFITDRGLCEASEEGLLTLYPERRENQESCHARSR
jgi:methylthioribose-1-phosphate isomerase